MTRDVVNLNKVRKARAKAARRQEADQNAALHGLPKAAKAEARAKAKQEAERLSGKKRDDHDAT